MFCVSTICNDVLSRLIYGVIFRSLYYKKHGVKVHYSYNRKQRKLGIKIKGLHAQSWVCEQYSYEPWMQKKKEILFRGEECNKIGGTPKPTMQAYPLNIFIHISTTFSHPWGKILQAESAIRRSPALQGVPLPF